MAGNSASKARTGVILNYSFLICNNVASLLVVRSMISGMGESVYGMYSLALTVMTFFTLSEFGIGNAFINRLVKFRTENDEKATGNYIFVMAFVYLTLSLAVSVLCVGLSFAYPLLLSENWTAEQTKTVRDLMLLLTVNCFLTFAQNYLFAILISCDRFAFTRVCHIVRITVRTVVLLALTNQGVPIYLVAVTDILLTLGLAAVYFIKTASLKLPLGYTGVDGALLKKNVLSMLSLYVIPMLDNFYWGACGTVLAIYFDAQTVGVFAIALTFCQVFIQLSVSISHMRLTKVTELEQSGDTAALKKYINDSAVIQTAFLGFVLTGFAAIGRQFLTLWVGEAYVPGYLLALIMMAALFFPLSQSMLEINLYAKNRYFSRTVVIGMQAAVHLPLMYLLIPHIGIYGAAVSVAITQVIFTFGVMSLFYRRAGIETGMYILRITVRLLPSVALGFAAGFAIAMLPGNPLIMTAAAAFAAVLVYAAAVYRTYFSAGERWWIKGLLTRNGRD